MNQYTRDEFARLAARFGFEAADYGRPFDWGKDYYNLVGFRPRARRYHCIARRCSDGAEYLFTREAVLEQFRYGGLEWPPSTPTPR